MKNYELITRKEMHKMFQNEIHLQMNYLCNDSSSIFPDSTTNSQNTNVFYPTPPLPHHRNVTTAMIHTNPTYNSNSIELN